MKLKEIDGYIKAYDYKLKEYSDDYYTHLTTKYETEKNKELNNEINKVRTELISQYCTMESVLDYGCGTGNFIKYNNNAGLCYLYGYELIPKTVKWLKNNNIFIDPYKEIPGYITAICFWDVLEHLEDHKKLFKNIRKDTYLFVSIPIFDDLSKVKESKHYLPDEHLWYFTESSFIDYMASHNINTLKVNNDEELLGRTQIKTFVLQKL